MPKKGRTEAELAKICYFHNHGGCKYSAKDCKNGEHVIVTAAEKSKLTRTPSKAPRKTSNGKEGGGGGTPRQTATSRVPKIRTLWCKEFVEHGTCKELATKGSCRFPHIDAQAVASMKKAYGENLEYFPTNKVDKGKGKG